MRPEPRQMEWVTPSSFEELRRCARSAAYRRDERFDQLTLPNEWSMLGSAAHRVFEESARGQLASDADAARAWDEAVEAEWRRLKDSRLLAPAPSPGRARGYTLARQRTLRRVSLTGERRSASARHAVELTLCDERLRLRGRVDLVEETGSGARIIDYKSALHGHDALSPAHRRQLLLYTHLWHHVHGEWPLEAAIEYLDGGVDVLDLDPSAAERVATDAAALRNRFNRAIEGSSGFTPALVAEICRNCDFQCVCDEYLDTASTSVWGASVSGEVTSVARTSDGVTLVMKAARGTMRADGQFTVSGLPTRLAPSVGDTYAFSRLRSRGAGRAGVDWQTRYWSTPTRVGGADASG